VLHGGALLSKHVQWSTRAEVAGTLIRRRTATHCRALDRSTTPSLVGPHAAGDKRTGTPFRIDCPTIASTGVVQKAIDANGLKGVNVGRK
jgi:hypothetical protein